MQVDSESAVALIRQLETDPRPWRSASALALVREQQNRVDGQRLARAALEVGATLAIGGRKGVWQVVGYNGSEAILREVRPRGKSVVAPG